MAIPNTLKIVAVAQFDDQGVINTIVTATDGSGVVVNVQQKDLRQATQDIANNCG